MEEVEIVRAKRYRAGLRFVKREPAELALPGRLPPGALWWAGAIYRTPQGKTRQKTEIYIWKARARENKED
jgi:hypothetical protein